ncbi:MAG: DUF4426 domain-containing protein [Oceanospirillaceae bacterium]|jgi:hypothetical protein|uniref:DUF4426 domain-containing protein n=1 Tax=Marinobacterium litorale TaxID=404770 RepID=UPI00041A59B0|nr:DUF4426 domain-containing protein [Marinobacterium litorale]MBS97984.1 DUF4426 domain-containing protein [Oceanospirillaceae bacterium]
MSVYHALSRFIGAAALALFALNLHAEQAISDGEYEIHYNAFNSSFVTPEVAQQYGLTRSQYRALVNVAVLRLEDDGSKTPIRARIRGEASNLLQQSQQLEFKQIDEGNAIYYLGSFRFTDEEQLTISLEVSPDANRPPYTIEFQQTFYTDGD